MALININIYSEILKRDIQCNVCIPTVDADMCDEKLDFYKEQHKYPCLVLLHGAYGDYSNWCRYTEIEQYANIHKTVVVMPSIHNSFAMNEKHGERFEDFICQELLAFVRFLFPVSSERVQTTIGGVSMGGYAAFRLAALYPELFGQAISLSGGLDLNELKNGKSSTGSSPFRWNEIYGQEDVIDIAALYDPMKGGQTRYYMACGADDFVYTLNTKGYNRFKHAGMDVTFLSDEGTHNWKYWNEHIEDAMVWALNRGKEACLHYTA